jgi:HSP20 family protein
MSNPNFDPMKKSLNTIRDSVNKLIEEGMSMASGAQTLPVDVVETDTAVIVKAGPVLGIQPQDIDVSIVGDKLTIKGEIRPDPDAPEGTYLRRERKVGAFSRTVTIPRLVKADQAAASFTYAPGRVGTRCRSNHGAHCDVAGDEPRPGQSPAF